MFATSEIISIASVSGNRLIQAVGNVSGLYISHINHILHILHILKIYFILSAINQQTVVMVVGGGT